MIIKGRFDSYSGMVAAFSQGPSYTDIWYGEHVLIDTPNKNDKDNGKIYRRGLNFDEKDKDGESTGGAQYVGQIVGPSSGTPYFQMLSYDAVEKKKDLIETDGNTSYLKFPLDADKDGYADTKSETDPSIVVTDDKSKAIGALTFNRYLEDGDYAKPARADSSLVPGKDVDGEFHDEIKYTWVNVRQDNADEDSWLYVGFQIPYLVHDFYTYESSPYDSEGNLITDTNTGLDYPGISSVKIEELDKNQHPFYQRWLLGIPKGIKGDTIRNLRVVTLSKDYVGKIYTEDAIDVDATSGAVKFDKTKTYSFASSDYNKKQVYVYDFYWYDSKRNPDISTNSQDARMVYVADYTDVEDITIAEDGTFVVYYKNNTSKTFSKLVRYMQEVSLNTNTGHLNVTMNNDGHGLPSEYNWDLDWIKDISVSDDGIVTASHTTSPQSRVVRNDLSWVTDVSLDTSNGKFKMTFNNNNKFKNIDTTLPWFNNATTDADGTTRLKMSNGTEVVLKQSEDTSKPFQLRTVDNVTFATLGAISGGQSDTNKEKYSKYLREDKHIGIKYNNETSVVNIGNSLNSIQDMCVRPGDMHLLVLFSDPEVRPSSPPSSVDTTSDSYSWTDSYGRTWTNNTTGISTDNPLTEKDIYWQDFGSIKDSSGIMIGMRLAASSYGNISDVNEVIDKINELYPDGLQGELQGKIIIWTDDTNTSSTVQYFYAYDYDDNTWFYLGTLGERDQKDVGLSVNGAGETSEMLKQVSVGGVLLKTKTYTSDYFDSSIPAYWSATYQG